MFPVDPSTSVRYAVAPPPPPPTVTVKPHDTVDSIAKTYGVTPEELARNNGIATTTTLSEGQVLTLPPNAVQPEQSSATPKAALTPKQKTDAAYTAYQQAQAVLASDKKSPAGRADVSADSAAVGQAKQQFDAAVQAEIAGQVATAQAGVPGQFQTPEKQLITQSGNDILARYKNDPAATTEINNTIADYQVQRQAAALIPGYSGNWTAADKLKGITLTGQPQAVVDAVLANPQVQGWLKQAAADIGKPYNGVDSGKLYYSFDQAQQASGNLAIATDGMPPQLAAALTQASMPTIQKIAQIEIGSAGSMVPFDTVQSVLAKLGNGPQADAVIQQAAQAYAEAPGAALYLTRGGANSELASTIVNSPDFGSAGNPAFAIALGNALKARGQTDAANDAFAAAGQGVHDYLANNGGSPLKAYDAARSGVAAKEKELGELLSNAGPLTDAQKQAFIKAYRSDPENAKAYQAEADSAKKLATWMETNQQGLIFAAGQNPASAKQLYTAMQDLAQSGQGVEALKFAGYVKADANASKAFAKFSDYQTTFMNKALESAQGQLLAEQGGDTNKAGHQLLELAEPIFKGQDGWALVKENYSRMADGETKAFEAKQYAEAYSKLSGGGKAWATLAVMNSTINGASTDQLNTLIGAMGTAGGKVDEVGTGAVQALTDAGKFGAFTEAAGKLTEFTAKFVPGLAAVANTSAFISDFQKAAAGNPFYAIAMAGDMFALVGGALESTGVGEVPGAFLTGLGMVLAAPFEFVGSIVEGKQEQKELQEGDIKYMEAAGIPAEKAELLAKDGASINAMADQLKMTPEQAQEVLEHHPDAFGQGAGYTQGVINALQACQVKPGDVDGFLDALGKDDPNYLSTFFNQLVAANGSTASALVKQANLADFIGGGGFANTKAYVQAHSPNVFSADGASQRKADRDYNLAMSSAMDQQQQIGNLLKSNTGAAYQAEMIKVMKDNGSLDGWVQVIGTQYGFVGLPDVAKSAIQTAQQAGVLTAADAQKYLGELG